MQTLVPAAEEPPSSEEVRAQLDRILTSGDFNASVRNRDFLRYVVEETLAGRAAYIKGFTVAQEVFGRGTDFDPQLDPVVRIEASRLRRSLEHYYLTAGKAEPVLIELPKGGYVPRFEGVDQPVGTEVALSSTSEPASVLKSSEPVRPSILVLPFENLGGELNGDLLARGITEELISRLLAYKELSVVSANISFNLETSADPVRLCIWRKSTSERGGSAM